MPECQWWCLYVAREQSLLEVKTISNTATEASTVELPAMESRNADILVVKSAT